LNARLAPGVRAFLAAEIQAAGGREVSFFADLDQDGVVTGARVGARGTVDMVFIEVQTGPILSEDDSERLEDQYGRV